MSTVFPPPALEPLAWSRRARFRAVAIVACATLVATSLPARPAFAQDAPPAAAAAAAPADPAAPYDEVTLRNGGMLRGTIVSIDPYKEVVILIQGTAEQRHVPAADVARIERGKGDVPMPPMVPFPMVSPPLPPPLPPLSAPTLGAPRIHIVSDRPITLHGATPDLPLSFGRYQPVACVAPCDQIVDGRGGQLFYFAGDEIPRSDAFRLSEKSGDVRVSVSGGSYPMRSVGDTGIVLGSIGAGVGTILLIAGAAINSANSPDPSLPASQQHPPDTTGQTFVTAAEATLVASGVALVTGIVLSTLSHTRYDFQTAASGGTVRF
jgi:hypothetical protein